MGKVQKKKAMRRHNPMRVPDSHIPKGLDSAASSTQKDKVEAVLPIIQKMNSEDITERTWACAAVSNLIQNDPATRRLLQGKNVVGTLITRLSDSSEEVAAEATGALRNLCIDGGFDICAEMFNKGIMGPLTEFIPKLSTTLQNVLDNSKPPLEKVQELVYEFAENIITILWCLSETSNKALNAINSISLVPFLMAFLINRTKLPRQVVHAAAQCLYVLSEDNPPAIQNIRSESEYIACLVAISTTPQGPNDDEWDIGIRVLACGSLRNISPLPAALNASSIDIDRSIALPLITPLLSYSLEEAVEEVKKTLVDPPTPAPQNNALKFAKLPKSDDKSPAEIVLERIERRFRVLQLSLEILTGVCAQLPDPEPVPEEVEDEDQDADMDQEEVLDDGIIQSAEDDAPMDEEPSSLLPSPEADQNSIKLLTTLIPLLLSLSTPTSMSFPPSSSTATITTEPTHLPTTSALTAVHISALECLSNLLLSFPTSDTGPVNPVTAEVAVAAWPRAWATLTASINAPSTTDRRMELSVAALGVLWGLARLARGVLVPRKEQVELLVQVADSTQADEQVQVKCVGILGSLAQNTGEVEVNKVIAQYLLSYIHPTPRSAEPTLHALSLLIDIYADETNTYDTNFRSLNGTEVLASSITTLRKLVRSIDRRKEGGGELRRWAEEVEGNIRGFVTYRRKLKI
ncbi:putative ARM-like repeat-containing protein C1703,03c OS=Schizosaccharomyces pombe (strain 972 / ATCC 24843) GN=SPBC1703.03c PE=4 SV=1 [Rhizoctonia solani AG-1 IB]|uniref:Putative ARM-like repeat-containing protein C1703,03c n=1 Tax=Thanatephorus cucumeris (strain AG1-IB / isolate 7/3/14) TaxID=1108050 RepID=A0A0B7FEW6_THACB|nr:putative ARM-like repeat-containing protein C1703,03c OS=Schizosaccharomyces pombe (strain 972 / ATCC 24843) GN=SPBC1703.03c PE=4 SV=1 [Rhizoctonia solani AG-1 IB]